MHWTEAARGMMHEEVPIDPGVVCEGLQIFVNLRSDLKLAEPRTYHLESADIPLWTVAGGRVRIVVGGLDAMTSPVQPRTDCALWDVSLDAHSSIALPLPDHWNAFGILTRGSLGGFHANGLAAVRFAKGTKDLRMATHAAPARIVILAGAPLREPLAFGGPFVMNTQAQLLDAKRRFAAGEMGRLAASF